MSDSSSSSVMKTSNISFKSVTAHPGKYRLLKIPLNNLTGNTVTLDSVSSQLMEFKLPAICYNLSKSFLSYNIELPAVAAVANWAFNDTLEIAQSLTFGTAGGLNLVDIAAVNNYISVARKIDISQDDYLSGDVTGGLVKSDLTSANWFPPTYAPVLGNIFDLPATASRLVGAAGLEPQYARVGQALNTALDIQRTFPLSGVTGTVLSDPKDSFFGPDNMYLRIQTAVSGKVGFTSTSIADPTVGVAALVNAPIVKNIYLYLAVEKDDMICQSIMQKYASGQLKYTIPFTYTFKYTTVGAGSNSIQIQLTSQYGKLLKRLLYAPFPSAETLNNAYNHSNWSGVKVTSYQTFLDSQPLQDAVLNCVQQTIANPLNVLDDFRENKAILKRSGAISSPSTYQLNWFHMDRFTEPSSDPQVNDSQIFDGLSLELPKSWSINVNTSAVNQSHYVFAQFLRMLSITPQGIMFD